MASPYGNGSSRKYLLASLTRACSGWGLDYVDIFYSHRVDENTPMEETAAALAQAVQSGKAFVCRYLLLFAGTNAANGRTFARLEDPAAYSPAVL